jgi:hypothetical protein
VRNIPQVFDVDGNVKPEAEWVVAGEGTASMLWDGWPVLVDGGRVYTHKGEQVACSRKHKAWLKAMRKHQAPLREGWYTLVGPNINGNPHKQPQHLLVRDGETSIPHDPRTFESVYRYLKSNHTMLGILWVHEDGREAVVTKDFFRIRWPG